MEPVDSSEQGKTFPSLTERLAVTDKELGIARKGTPETKKEYVRLIHDYLEPYSKRELTKEDIGKKFLVYIGKNKKGKYRENKDFSEDERENTSIFNMFYIGTLKDVLSTKGKIVEKYGREAHTYYIFTDIRPFYSAGVTKRGHNRYFYIQTIETIESSLRNLKDALKFCDENDLNTLIKDITGAPQRWFRNPKTSATMTLGERLKTASYELNTKYMPLEEFSFDNGEENEESEESEDDKVDEDYATGWYSLSYPDVIVFTDSTLHEDTKYYYEFSKASQPIELVKKMADLGMVSVQSAGLILEYLGVTREQAEKYIREQMIKQGEATRRDLYPGMKLIKGGTKRRNKKQRKQRKTRKQRRR